MALTRRVHCWRAEGYHPDPQPSGMAVRKPTPPPRWVPLPSWALPKAPHRRRSVDGLVRPRRRRRLSERLPPRPTSCTGESGRRLQAAARAAAAQPGGRPWPTWGGGRKGTTLPPRGASPTPPPAPPAPSWGMNGAKGGHSPPLATDKRHYGGAGGGRWRGGAREGLSRLLTQSPPTLKPPAFIH